MPSKWKNKVMCAVSEPHYLEPCVWNEVRSILRRRGELTSRAYRWKSHNMNCMIR